MIVNDIVFEDFCNYKEPSMFILFPKCSFKCCKENEDCHCQNSPLANTPDVYVSTDFVVSSFGTNSISKAVVCGGLEPFDSWADLQIFIAQFRAQYISPIIIYMGYNKDEIQDKLKWLSSYENIVVKFGRYIPNQEHHYDEILGVNLASDNQYAEVIHSEDHS